MIAISDYLRPLMFGSDRQIGGEKWVKGWRSIVSGPVLWRDFEYGPASVRSVFLFQRGISPLFSIINCIKNHSL